MLSTRVPDNEAERLEALRILEILDTVPEQGFDDLTLLAATICATPISLVSLVDGERQWFKSRRGLSLEQTPRELSFCAHAILEPGRIMEIPDTAADRRFTDNPLVTGEPRVRFYAGAPLVTDAGHAIGAVCVLDHKPRRLEPPQRAALQALARQAAAQLKLRAVHHAMHQALETARRYQTELEEYQSRLRKLNMQLHTQAITDPLTGLYNRLALAQQLNQAVARAGRTGEPLSLLLIDVDHFKAFNDSFGHLQGDEALRRMAEILYATAREADIVARYGGEEFLVILPATGSDGALALAERIRQQVHSARWDRRDLTVSIGVVTRQAADPRCSAQLLIEDADSALYRAKAAGRNCVMAADPSRG
ncbi:MAG: diguanylate cyclase [Steroidobacteraceae bacterium]